MTGIPRLMEGVVQEWDSSTGENVVTINGGSVANLKSLTGESASLAVGDVVLVMSTGDRFYVFGKATTPGDPGTVPTWTADITALSGQVDTIQTVTIPAVQADVVIVQGDVTELNTVTVPAVQATADAAQADATQAALDAAAADAAAAQAVLDAAGAQADATQAGTDAATAQGTANTAVTNAATAQGTANTAASAAATAQAAAVAAQADADALQADLDAAEAAIATLTGTTLPALQADLDAAEAAVIAAQADVDAILPIGTTDITDDAITTPKINAGAITAVKIAADTITASQIAASAITASELAANAVIAGKIAAGTIVAADIAANTITAAKIAAGTITATEIAGSTITAAKIAGGTITGTQLSATAIDGKTITGALFRTAASGQRIEIDSSTTNKVRLYSGHASESVPGYVASILAPAGVGTQGAVALVAPVVGGSPEASLTLAGDTLGGSIARMVAEQITLSGGEDVTILSDYIDLEASGTSGIQLLSSGGPIALLTTSGDPFTYNGANVTTTDDIGTLTANCSSFIDLTTTEVDVPGCTLTFTVPRAGARYMVTGSFYMAAVAGGTAVATGKLSVDGVNQTPNANFTGTTTLMRANVSQTWVGTFASGGSHTLKLRGVTSSVAAGSGTFRVNTGGTSLTALILE